MARWTSGNSSVLNAPINQSLIWQVFSLVAGFEKNGQSRVYRELTKFKDIDAQVNFDISNSGFAVINSDNIGMNGKIAVSIYRLTVAGRG
jgi:hypothetical protein